ncbi:MAG: regulatory protein RecX [Vicinamibacterales bacterium]
MTAYSDALRMLARREHSVADVRSRLLDREHTPEEIEAAITRLLELRALDDRRVARAYARTASALKGRGRLRVQRELQVMGIARDVANEAIAEVFGDLDERALIEKAVQKKLRGGKQLTTMQERARLYQFLMRQGFTPAAVSAALRRIGGSRDHSNSE